MSSTPPHQNRLAAESSPYLRQHAHNPVDWHPWGEEALQKAKDENKPIFLSIGYSACHWCHVMAHESFEDEATAQVMNELFINIKVDREERPDLDQIYQSAYQLLAGRGGGWPLSMFLTPELGPFWGGTYFPDQPRHNMPSFKDVLRGVHKTYADKPTDVAHNVAALTQGLATMNHTRTSKSALSDTMLEASAEGLIRAFDSEWGGFGSAPKFPSTMALSFLLTRWYRTGNDKALHVVDHSLQKMADGGIYDHLGGGFARYSVDDRWLVPHFEKMLYDNALLIPLYLDACRATGREQFATVARDSLAYLEREMLSPEGGFYAAQDADSEGVEGKFFVWRPGEVEEVLAAADADGGKQASALFCATYGVSEEGNFEGENVLWRPQPLADIVEEFHMSEAGVLTSLADSRARLLAHRGGRIAPDRDDKIITAWNGLAISAFATASEVLDDGRYAEVAARAADFLLTTLTDERGELLRCYAEGTAKYAAYLDDYAFLAQGLLDLYQATGLARWLDRARQLVDRVNGRFAAPKGGYYFTAEDHEELPARMFSGQDQSIPSGNAVMAHCLLRLHHLTGQGDDLTQAERTVRPFLNHAVGQPPGFSYTLAALDLLVHPPRVVAIAAEPGDDTAADWRRKLAAHYLPDTFTQQITPGSPAAGGVEGKLPLDGKTTAYVCQAGTCAAPVTDWDGLCALVVLREGGSRAAIG